MPILIGQDTYISSAELIQELSVSRQTFWRWRREGRIPTGHLFRGGRLVFSSLEADRVRAFANRLEPTAPSSRNQLKLFNGGEQGT
jgi:predicted DNA-binding transcriptional regulator AlpA